MLTHDVMALWDEVMRVKALIGIDTPIKGNPQGSWSSVSCDPQWDDGTGTERVDIRQGIWEASSPDHHAGLWS